LNAEKQLRLACRRQIPVVVQYEGDDGRTRQTPPTQVDLVTPHGEAWLVRPSGNPLIVDVDSVTLVHPQIEEEQ
jgi:hypothetical protein